jgi:hypothetical protein
MDEKMLQQLADRQAITDLIHQYCRAVDRLDVPLGRAIFHEDGYADYGADVYQGNGRDVIDRICKQHQHLLYHSHNATNILIELDGDRAASETYVVAALRMRRNDKLVQIDLWGRYVDQWSKRGGLWGIDKRISIRDFDEIREVTPMKEHDRGKRDMTDPSYAAFNALRKPTP